ncbi:MAG: hypothetical protein M0Z82_16505 [Actinomycetota bacterium]|nr:hypothetical protein [Actinomycetota bacterium]
MASSGTAAGALLEACMAVKPPGPGVCRTCCGALAGASATLCQSCRAITAVLGPLYPVTPISLATDGSQIYAALVQYKSDHRQLAATQRLRLAGLVEVFLTYHLDCVAPHGFDVVTVVPSSRRPAGSNPLAATLKMTDLLASRVEALLAPGPGKVERNLAEADAYVADAARVGGRRVLLFDDTYTTGAHLHASVAALMASGAERVYPVVLGRRQNDSWPPSHGVLAWSAQPANRWSPRRCVHCWSQTRQL